MQALNPLNMSLTSPTFGMFMNTIKDDEGYVVYRNDTAIFRDDLDFNRMAKFLDRKYASVPQVNVVAHACSDGEEIFSVLSILKHKLGARYKKFTPVVAKDIDENALEKAKSGICYFTYDEYENASKYLQDNIFDYFDRYRQYDESVYKRRGKEHIYFGVNYKVCDEILNNIKFEKGDILEDAPKMNLKNTVLFARNFWPYLKKEQIEELAGVLSKADKSFTLVIGDYDREYGVNLLLERYGFVETEVKNIFEIPRTPKSKIRTNSIYSYPTNKIYGSNV